jgi:hypothetical protein
MIAAALGALWVSISLFSISVVSDGAKAQMRHVGHSGVIEQTECRMPDFGDGLIYEASLNCNNVFAAIYSVTPGCRSDLGNCGRGEVQGVIRLPCCGPSRLEANYSVCVFTFLLLSKKSITKDSCVPIESIVDAFLGAGANNLISSRFMTAIYVSDSSFNHGRIITPDNSSIDRAEPSALSCNDGFVGSVRQGNGCIGAYFDRIKGSLHFIYLSIEEIYGYPQKDNRDPFAKFFVVVLSLFSSFRLACPCAAMVSIRAAKSGDGRCCP